MVEHFGILFKTKSAFLICLYLFLSERKNTSSLLTIRINVYLLNKEDIFIRKNQND